MQVMRRYKCHKIVRAAKIETLHKGRETGDWSIGLERLGPVVLTEDFIQKHHPAVGGYLVEYEDGYRSYSPAKAFEEGYTLLNG